MGSQRNELFQSLYTNRRFLTFSGLIRGSDRWFGYVRGSVLCLLMFWGGVRFFLKDLLEPEELTLLEIVENFHWFVLFSTTSLSSISILLMSDDYWFMEALVKNGFFDYNLPMSREEISIVNTTNKQVYIVTILYTVAVSLAEVAQFCRAPLTTDYSDGQYHLLFKGWFPYKMTNNVGYTIAIILQVCGGVFPGIGVATMFVIIVALASHLIAQVKILQVNILKVDTIALSGTQKDVSARNQLIYSEELMSHLISCVKHHEVILLYYDKFQKYSNYVLLNTSLITGIMICTLGFIFTDPNVTSTDLSAFLILIVPEVMLSVIYCWFGQAISSEIARLRELIYNSNWYMYDIKIQKVVYMMQIRCTRPTRLTGGGLQEFSYPGLAEIMSTSYSYLNMILLLRQN